RRRPTALRWQRLHVGEQGRIGEPARPVAEHDLGLRLSLEASDQVVGPDEEAAELLVVGRRREAVLAIDVDRIDEAAGRLGTCYEVDERIEGQPRLAGLWAAHRRGIAHAAEREVCRAE